MATSSASTAVRSTSPTRPPSRRGATTVSTGSAAESVKAFFDEGGARVYFQRVQPGGAVAVQPGLQRRPVRARRRPTSRRLPPPSASQHVVGIADGNALDVVSDDGSVLGTVTVASVDYRDRVRRPDRRQPGSRRARGQALAVILPVDTTLAVLTIEAASAGVWGDDLSVRLLPVSRSTALARRLEHQWCACSNDDHRGRGRGERPRSRSRRCRPRRDDAARLQREGRNRRMRSRSAESRPPGRT